MGDQDAERSAQPARDQTVNWQKWVNFIFGRWISQCHKPIWRVTIL